MTLHEIQQTVDDLRVRHKGLDEKLLVTLLSAGGWDNTSIKEAVMLFAMSPQEELLPAPHDMLLTEATSEYEKPEEKDLLLSVGEGITETKEEELVTSSKVHNLVEESKPLLTGHAEPILLSEKLEQLPGNDKLEEVKEVQSLVPEPQQVTTLHEREIPDNLPLKPFETSSNVWPFSRYKDVFHTDALPITEPLTEHIQESVTEVIPAQVTPPEIPFEKVPLDKKDEGLIALASICFILILLILLYMYSLGRL